MSKTTNSVRLKIFIRGQDNEILVKVTCSLYGQTSDHAKLTAAYSALPCGRDEPVLLGIPMGPTGPMGIPWEWESLR